MKILLDTEWDVLVKDLNVSQKAELLTCIMGYPDTSCNIPVWQYMKIQFDKDRQKYQEKVSRQAETREKRGLLKSTAIYIDKDIDIDKEKTIQKQNIDNDSCSSNAKISVENSVENFRISDAFSFDVIKKSKPAFNTYLGYFPPSVVERAERTIKQKLAGKRLNLQQILAWIEQEHRFYNENNKKV